MASRGRQKLATFIRPEDEDVFARAGLRADWTDPGTHQMPIILPRSAIDERLDPKPTTPGQWIICSCRPPV